jgi:hypothetical protein
VYHIEVLGNVQLEGASLNMFDLQQHHRGLDAALKEAQEESDSHERREVGRSGRARDNSTPNKDIHSEHLGKWQLLQEKVLWPFTAENTDVQDGAEPLILQTC